jgi:hypothetical protein
MVSTFTTNKNLQKPGNGDYVDTWNVPLNSDMNFIDFALGGTAFFNATAGSQTLTNNILDPYSYIPLIIQITGAMSSSVTYTIPAGIGGQWVVYNQTTDSGGGPYTVRFISGSGTGGIVYIPRSSLTTIICDGTNVLTSSTSTSNAYNRTNFTATAGQTTFSVSYTPSRLDVFVNGVLLAPSDYTATNGTTVVLAVACSAGDPVAIMTY